MRKLGDGDYWVICDRSGFKVPASETKKEWNGLRVWRKFYEPRHPQDLLRGKKDDQTVPEPRTEAPDVFLATNEVTPESL